MSVHPAASPTRSTPSTGWVPFALVALVLIPASAGSLRLVEVFGGPYLMPANPRITASPLPVVVHIICAVPYAVLGAGTQVFTLGIGEAAFGTSELTVDLSLGAAWAINLAAAEYVIRRQGSRRAVGATTMVRSS